MGISSPIVWPIIEPAKFYCYRYDWFAVDVDDPCGAGFFIAYTQSCGTGQDFSDWRDRGASCVAGNVVTSWHTPGTHRVLHMTGPYDNINDCWDACQAS